MLGVLAGDSRGVHGADGCRARGPLVTRAERILAAADALVAADEAPETSSLTVLPVALPEDTLPEVAPAEFARNNIVGAPGLQATFWSNTSAISVFAGVVK